MFDGRRIRRLGLLDQRRDRGVTPSFTRPKLARILILLALFSLVSCDNQRFIIHEGVTVIPGDITIESQSQLAHLVGVKQILGNLYLSGGASSDPIRDLSPLSELIYVGGALRIMGLSHLMDFSHMSSLEVVGKDLIIQSMDELHDLDGLESLWGIGSRLIISRNPSLEDIAGLSGLRLMEQCQIDISNNASLTSLHGLGNLESFADPDSPGGILTIGNCPSLQNVSGLESIRAVSRLEISGCESLESLGGLSNLETVGWELILENLPLLPDLSDLASLVNCPEIDLSGLTAVESLYPLAIENLRDVRISDSGLTSIVGMPELSDFGTVRLLRNPQLSTLGGIAVNGSLRELWLFNNDELVDLTGLSSVAIGGHLSIDDCDGLLSLEHLSSISLLSGSLQITGNDNLISLQGAESIDSIMGGVLIRLNPMLCDTVVTAFLDSVVVQGGVSVGDNAACVP
jgi:hypothetical protein